MIALSPSDRARLARCAARLRASGDLGGDAEWLVDTLIRLAHPAADPVMERAAELRRACQHLGIAVGVDGHVNERAAARLVGRSPKTVKNWRHIGSPIPWRSLKGRISYSLADLAEFLVAGSADHKV